MNSVARILYAASVIEELTESGYNVINAGFDDDGIVITYEGDGWEATLILRPKD